MAKRYEHNFERERSKIESASVAAYSSTTPMLRHSGSSNESNTRSMYSDSRRAGGGVTRSAAQRRRTAQRHRMAFTAHVRETEAVCHGSSPARAQRAPMWALPVLQQPRVTGAREHGFGEDRRRAGPTATRVPGGRRARLGVSPPAPRPGSSRAAHLRVACELGQPYFTRSGMTVPQSTKDRLVSMRKVEAVVWRSAWNRSSE